MSKELVAKEIAKRFKNNEVVGLGSGSTTELALIEVGKRIKNENLTIFGVPTSARTAVIAEQNGIIVLNPLTKKEISWAFDGADEVDPAKNMIKGRGAAMLVEKIIAKSAKKFVIIVSEDKLVSKLGEKFSVPVEVIPSALSYVERELKNFKASEVVLRESSGKYGPVVTEQNNFVLDVKFTEIATDLESKLKSITGVVESGLFIGLNPEVLVSKGQEVVKI